MNRRVLFPFLALMLVSVGGQAFGDGLFRKLPSEGSWAKFRMSEEWSDGAKRETDVTLKAFGKEIVDGVECRWIELNYQTPDGKQRRAHRFLSPVAAMETGADPLGTATDIWVRINDGESRREMSWDGFLPRLIVPCPPKLEGEAMLSETEPIEAKDGSLLGSVVTGSHSREFYSGTIDVDLDYRIITNDSLPFGVGRATVKVTESQNCDLKNPEAVCEVITGTVVFLLTDFGGGAEAVVQMPRIDADELSDEREPD